MAVIVLTPKPRSLWNAIKSGIAEGTVRTWKLHKSGKYITHKSTQWAGKAWLKASISEDVLTFNIVRPQNKNVSTEAYAEYHALIIRMLLADFDEWFTNVVATAMPKAGDIVGSK